MTAKKILIVDEQDNPTGGATIPEAWADGLYHRVVRVHVEDEMGRVLLQKRASTMDSFPGCWDHSAAGHVDEGETYEQAAERELSEELGIQADLTEVGRWQSHNVWGDKTVNRFNRLYRATIPSDTSFTLQQDEVAEVKWVTPDELRQLVVESKDNVTDGLAEAVQQLYGESSDRNDAGIA